MIKGKKLKNSVFLNKNKKGSLLDLPFISGMLLALGLMLLIGFKVTDEFTNGAVQHIDDLPARAVTANTELRNHYPGILDNTFLFLTIGLGIITLVLAALVRIHPIFIPFYFVGLTFMIFASGIHSNIYQEFAANSQMSGLAAEMTFVPLIMTYLPLIIGVFGIFLMVIQYKTWQIQQ